VIKLRGEVWWVNFDPSVGQEIKKRRPAVILSNNISNKHLDRYQVVPLSSQLKKVYPSETIVKIDGKNSKAMIDQLTTVSELRFVSKIAVLSQSDIASIEKVIKTQLNLE
jgi:mRNA interferase MazF